MVPAGQVALAVSARYGRDAPPISGGLDLARLRREAGRRRRSSAWSRRTGRRRRPSCCRRATTSFMPSLGTRQRGQGGATARRDRARSLRNSRRRHSARRPRRRCAHPGRPDIVRYLQRQPVRHHRAAADRAERDDRRRRAASGRHLLHRLELRRRQFRGALGRPRPGRASSPTSSSLTAPP